MVRTRGVGKTPRSARNPQSGKTPRSGTHRKPQISKTPRNPQFGKTPRISNVKSLGSEFIKLCEKHKNVMFRANGKLIGKFNYHDNVLACRNVNNKICMEITLYSKEIYLDDFFFEANNLGYTCNMKPKEGDTAGNQRILNTLLSYLAFQTGVDKITLIDYSTKKFNTCPEVSSSIFKLAGRQTYYERFAGFMNEHDNIFEALRALPLSPDDLDLAKNIGFKGVTVGELASFILPLCKDRKDEDERSDTINELLAYLNTLVNKEIPSRHYEKFTYQKFTTNYKISGKYIVFDIQEI